MKNYKQLLKNIDTFIFDFDGVLSDGNVITTSDGEQLRVGSVKDGYAIHHAIKNNFLIVIISGGNSVSMNKRCEALGIKDYFFSVSDKEKMLKEFLEKNNIDPSTVVFMGDDIPDYNAMQEVILPVCPADACNEIKSISKYISPFNGGRGCVRDIIEQVLKVQKKWMNENAFYWSIHNYMRSYFKLIRAQNLFIIAVTMFFVRYCLIAPVLKTSHVYLQLSLLDFSLLVLSIVLITAGGYAINDYFDVKIDAINKPDKNVLQNKIPLRRGMALHTTLSIIGGVIGIYVSFKAGNIKLSFIPIVMGFILWFYSVKYKRIVLWGNLTVSLLSAFSLLIVWLFEFFALKSHPFAFANMVGNFGSVNILVFSYALFAFLASMIREIIKDCEDIEGDRAQGCYTFPIAFGVEKAKKLVLGLVILTFILVSLAEIKLYSWDYQYMIVYLAVTVQLLYVYMITLLLKAKEKKDFTFLSNLAKIIIVAGVLSMQVLYVLL